MASLRPALFLDKDGTLIRDVPYNVNPALIELLPNAIGGLQLIHEAGYAIVIVSNQSGVAKGLFRESDLSGVEARLRHLLLENEIPLAGFFYCPHHPEGEVAEYSRACSCRKPQPGMLLQAAQDLQLDVANSWMVGDLLDDVEAGHRAGCRAIHLDSGGETEWIAGPHRQPEFTASDLREAANWILEQSPQFPSRSGERHACHRA